MNILGSDIFHVYRVHPQADGSTKRQFVGRFLEHDGELHVLEDHLGVLSHLPEGPVTGKTNAALTNLRRSAYIDIVTADDLQNGRRLDLIPPRDFSQQPAEQADDTSPQSGSRPSIFEYVRDGQTHTVEFRNGQCFLDGHHLDNAEASRLLEHHRKGFAVLRYRKGGG